MGLLDWQPSTESLFPDYSYAALSSVAAKKTTIDQSQRTPSVTSSASSSSSASSAASASITKTITSRTSTSLTMLLTKPSGTTSTPIPLPRRRKRAATFDIYGADEELQSAESTIAYCDKCLKHCSVHCGS